MLRSSAKVSKQWLVKQYKIGLLGVLLEHGWYVQNETSRHSGLWMISWLHGSYTKSDFLRTTDQKFWNGIKWKYIWPTTIALVWKMHRRLAKSFKYQLPTQRDQFLTMSTCTTCWHFSSSLFTYFILYHACDKWPIWPYWRRGMEKYHDIVHSEGREWRKAFY